MGPKRHALKAAALRARDLFVGEAPLGTDSGDDVMGVWPDELVEGSADDLQEDEAGDLQSAALRCSACRWSETTSRDAMEVWV